MKNKIAWEKWEDIDLPQMELPEETEEPFSPESEMEEDLMSQLNFGPMMPVPRIRTPLGVFSIDDPLRPSKMFDCWIGHTNFDITSEIALQLEEIPGIEAFKVLSRYRFFIGVAQLFDFRDVRETVQDIIGGESSSISTGMEDVEVIEVLKTQLMEFKRWAVFCSRDGFIDYIATNEEDDQEFELKLKDFKKDKSSILITSDDHKNGVI
jgi:hypothetical protein|tara:strand:- start:637 stop:1263 length:627 start_codon:yes stop_codon:yes gene_type:complete